MITRRFRVAARLLAASLGLLLLLVQGGLEPMHACPIHEAMPAETTAPAGHAHHETAPTETDAEHCCTCLGSCLTAPPIVITPTAATAVWAVLITSVADVSGSTDLPRAPLPRLLPFATAPPLS